MKRSGFSMIELVFVIVILGVLAAVAVPRFVTTRTDAQVAMLRSDIASAMKAIPARIFAENIDPTQSAPQGFTNGWGEWIIDTAGLDRGRWEASTDEIKVIVSNTGGTGGNTKQTCGSGTGFLKIDKTNGTLIFDPSQLSAATGNGNAGKTLCEGLKNSYPSGSNRVIPLATTGAVKF